MVIVIILIITILNRHQAIKIVIFIIIMCVQHTRGYWMPRDHPQTEFPGVGGNLRFLQHQSSPGALGRIALFGSYRIYKDRRRADHRGLSNERKLQLSFVCLYLSQVYLMEIRFFLLQLFIFPWIIFIIINIPMNYSLVCHRLQAVNSKTNIYDKGVLCIL